LWPAGNAFKFTHAGRVEVAVWVTPKEQLRTPTLLAAMDSRWPTDDVAGTRIVTTPAGPVDAPPPAPVPTTASAGSATAPAPTTEMNAARPPPGYATRFLAWAWRRGGGGGGRRRSSGSGHEPGEEPCDHLCFAVRDTGIGVKADALASLFRPFQQAEASTVRHYGGSGLGLAICRELALLLRSYLLVRSQVGVGTAFCFTVPLIEATEDPDLSAGGFRGRTPASGNGTPASIALALPHADPIFEGGAGHGTAAATTTLSLGTGVSLPPRPPLLLPSRGAGVAAAGGPAFFPRSESAPDPAPRGLGYTLSTSTDAGTDASADSPQTGGVSGGSSAAAQAGTSGMPGGTPGPTLIMFSPWSRGATPPFVDSAAGGLSARTPTLSATASGETLAEARPHVLLVEDNPVNARVLQRLLAVAGCDAMWVADGAAAVDTYTQLWQQAEDDDEEEEEEEEDGAPTPTTGAPGVPGSLVPRATTTAARVPRGPPFAAILMDLNMPRMSGLEATRELRTREAAQGWPRVPIIALTADDRSVQGDECRAAGMDDFLSKPTTIDTIRGVLSHYMPLAGRLRTPPAAGSASPVGRIPSGGSSIGDGERPRAASAGARAAASAAAAADPPASLL
jgi:CheY-like chemotaxis protein